MKIKTLLVGAAVGALPLGLLAAPPGLAVAATTAVDDHDHAHTVETLDVRDGAALVRPTTAQVDALRSLLADAGDGARARWDSRYGTPRTITPAPGSYLTAQRSGSAVDVARAFVSDHRTLFGLSAADVSAMTVRRDHVLPGTGTTVVNFQQVFGGVPSARDGALGVTVTKDGRVLAYAGSSARSTSLLGSFGLTQAKALDAVAESPAPSVDFAAGAVTRKVAGFSEFARGPFAAPSYVQRAAFPTADGARAAYRVLFVEKLDEAYEVVVDAQSGKTLYRRDLVDHESLIEPEGTVYPNYPGAPGRGGQPVVTSFGPTAESPSGYVDPTGLLGLPGPTTLGNNANTYANWSNFLVPADQGPRPISPTASFNEAFADNWGRTKCQVPSYAKDLNPAATSLFWHHNRIHDEYYDLGFTETAGNFQLNSSKGGQGGDAILGLVQAGAASGGSPTYTGRDNAYMLTLPDGIAPWSGMFLWEPINDAFEGPCRDGDFDAGVIQHEYSHGLSNRYVGQTDGALSTAQSGSMGEGWSDFYALDYLAREGLATDSVVGAYVTGNTTRGIRNWAYDQNPTTYGDVGYDLTGPEVHADGEIWTATLWDLRKDLVARYGETEGGEIARRIVTDGMPLTANDPSFIDARDGILLALANRYHDRDDFGSLADLVHGSFAERGLGVGASTKVTEDDPTGGNDTDPVPGFAHQNPALNGSVTGRVLNTATGKPVSGARVILGRFEARVTPSAVTGADGVFSIPAVRGSYPVTVQARGFGSRTLDAVKVTAGKATGTTVSMSPNLASEANGAKVVKADADGASRLVDDTEASSWAAPLRGSATVELAKSAVVDKVQVSAYTSSRFEGLKDFTLQTSTDGVNWQSAIVRKGAFGYQAPRPTAPDLHVKSFAIDKPRTARFVRFFADAPQGDTKTKVQVGDLQVFSSSTRGVEPSPPPPPDAPVTEQFTITGSNPTGDLTQGVTGTELATTCTAPPSSQDVDGHVSTLPKGFGNGAHTATATGTAATYDLDLYFYDASCALVGSVASAGADESGVIPSGAAYVLTQAYTGAATAVKLVLADTA